MAVKLLAKVVERRNPVGVGYLNAHFMTTSSNALAIIVAQIQMKMISHVLPSGL